MVRVVIEPTAEAVVAHYKFDSPLDSFRVAYPSDEIRDTTWKVLTPNVVREGTLFRSTNGRPIAAIDVEVRPWNELTNATYPCLIRVGEHGLAFFANYFIGEPSLFATTIEVEQARDRLVEGLPLGGNVWRVDTVARGEPGKRYIYIGKSGDIVEGTNARFVLPPGVAPKLVERIRTTADSMVKFYTGQFARPLQAKPLFLLAVNSETKGFGVQGEVTNGPAVALRLFGTKWQTFDESADTLDHLIAHETSHLWNASAERAPAWMWEGSADLLALDARVAVTNRLSKEGRRKHIESALNDCIGRLLNEPFKGRRSDATYVCGQTVFWLADAAEKRRSNGRSNVFAIWRRILENAEANGGVYGPDYVLAAIAPDEQAKKAISLFLTESGTERWKDLPARVAPLGIKLEAGPASDDVLRTNALFHILNQYCTGSRGMWEQTDYLRLDTGDRCGPLNGDPDVDALNGHNLFTDMPAAYTAATEACATNGDIVLTRTSSTIKVTAACKKPLDPAPPAFRISATP